MVALILALSQDWVRNVIFSMEKIIQLMCLMVKAIYRMINRTRYLSGCTLVRNQRGKS